MSETSGSGSRWRAGRIRTVPARPTPPSRNRTLLLFALGGAGIGVFLVIFLGSLGSDQASVVPPSLAPRVSQAIPAPEPPAPVAAPAPAVPVPAAPDPALEEERKRRAAEEKARAEAAARRKEEDERARREAAKRAYTIRKLKRREESVRRLDAARRRVREDGENERARQDALRRKLEGRKITVRLKNGMSLDNVVVRDITADELRLGFTFEGAVAEQSFPTGFIDDESFVGLIREVFREDGAAGAYETGRHLVLRRLWAEAEQAFKRCVELDASYAERVPDLSRILNNEAAFRGSARRIGADRLFIDYDFSDPAMAQDFTAQQPGELSVDAGALAIRTDGTSIWSLKDVDFSGDLEVDATVRIEGKGSLVLGCFFTWDKKGYLVVLNSLRPSGHVLYRSEGSKLHPLAVRRGSLLPPGVETRIRFTARDGLIRVMAGDSELVAASDESFGRGWVTLGAAAGAVRLSRLTVQGRVAATEIEKRFAEVEILVRRALESDLGRAGERRESEIDLSGEDTYFTEALDDAFLADYGRARAQLLDALARQRLTRKDVALFDPLLTRAPEFAPVHYWRGRIALAARRPELARACFARAAELDPDFHEAHLGLARSHLEEHDLDASRASVDRALALSPGHGPARALAGFLAYVDGDPKAAVEELELARRLAPSDTDVHDLRRTILNVIKGPPHLGCKYVKTFPNYTVMTDMSPEKTALYGRRLEAARAYFEAVIGRLFPTEVKQRKARVAIFNTREAYLTYGELTLSGRHEWTLGYYHPLFRELLLFEDMDLEASLHTLYHEAFHEFLAARLRNVPYWLNEGLAEYMGALSIAIGKKDAEVVQRGRLLPRRLRTLKAGLDRAIPFKDLIAQTPGEFYSGRVSFKYAQAWSMIHFFYEHEGGRHRPRIEAYLQALGTGGTPAEAYEAGFGDADMDALQKEWVDYVNRLELPK